MKALSRLLSLLAVVYLAPNARAANTITGITLSPSSLVSKRTLISVTVQETGACTVLVETNGA